MGLTGQDGVVSIGVSREYRIATLVALDGFCPVHRPRIGKARYPLPGNFSSMHLTGSYTRQLGNGRSSFHVDGKWRTAEQT